MAAKSKILLGKRICRKSDRDFERANYNLLLNHKTKKFQFLEL